MTKIVPIQNAPSRVEIKKIISTLVAEGRVKFHKHWYARKQFRKLTDIQAINCLKKGRVDEDPVMDLSHKGWKTALVDNTAGKRLRIVVCVQWTENALIITGYYD